MTDQREQASSSSTSLSRLLPSSSMTRSGASTSAAFTSSPLNPSPPVPPQPANPFMPSSPPPSGSSSSRLDDPVPNLGLTLGSTAATASGPSSSLRSHGSMILYRLADEKGRDSPLAPPSKPFASGKEYRESTASSSGESVISLSTDSKYPSGLPSGGPRGLIPYAYDPALDIHDPPDEEDMLHDPDSKGRLRGDNGEFPWRGLVNISVLITVILALLCLFIFYPVWTSYKDSARLRAIDGNIRINGTGQNPVLFQMPEPIDPDTPQQALTRTGFDGQEYDLVFSDEFNAEGRTFYPGDDPYWEAVDLWYGVTQDVEYYDPSQVTTRDGALVITLDSVTTTESKVTPGSTAPFTAEDNHNMQYRSGMVQTWNKFCFTTGYIEVSVTFPGPDENTQGYWPGAWTMGNLARPGYSATTEGMWPYTYDTCDLGTFPNQTLRDGSGPSAALHTDRGRARFNNELSWLSGQRLSACSCPGGDHPGPLYNTGRGAPEIDIFEAEKDKDAATGHVVSQSAQFGPFSHDYEYDSQYWTNFNDSRTRANSFRGSATQQSVSGLTRVPSDMFQGLAGGPNFKTFGFEYWSDPKYRLSGYINWQVDGQPSHRIEARAVGPDMGPEGSQVGQRLIPEEPMSIVLNLGMAENWQRILPETMMFPSEFRIDYVRVYQRRGHSNVGCSPKDRPTAAYINNHLEAYMNPNMTHWEWEIPRNELWEGSC